MIDLRNRAANALAILRSLALPRPLAIHMVAATGWVHPSVDSLSVEQRAVIAELDPWTPPRERAAA